MDLPEAGWDLGQAKHTESPNPFKRWRDEGLRAGRRAPADAVCPLESCRSTDRGLSPLRVEWSFGCPWHSFVTDGQVVVLLLEGHDGYPSCPSPFGRAVGLPECHPAVTVSNRSSRFCSALQVAEGQGRWSPCLGATSDPQQTPPLFCESFR